LEGLLGSVMVIAELRLVLLATAAAALAL
jgi:hypothetical protein